MSTLTNPPLARAMVKLPQWGIFAGLVAIWLLAHPYRGVAHDALFYTGQAFAWLTPEIFSKDLFFAFGSQDKFTVLSPIYGTLISFFGLEASSALIVVVAQLLWLSGLVRLVWAFTRDNQARVAALLFLAVGSGIYGDLLLTYGESFVSPRIFAEAAVLHGLAFALGGHIIWALVVVVLGALFHPLLALPGLVVTCLLGVFRDKRYWALIVLGAIAGILLVLFKIGPFARLTEIMDDQWFALVVERDSYVFPSQWNVTAWGWIVIQLSAVGSLFVVVNGQARILLSVILVTALGGLAVSMVGAELFRSVLIVQLQTWRAGWLLALAANMSIGLLLFNVWVRRENSLVLFLCIGTGALWFFEPAGQAIMALSILFCGVQLAGRLPTAPRWLVICVAALAAISLAVLVFARAFSIISNIDGFRAGTYTFVYSLVDFVVAAAVLAAAARLGWLNKRGSQIALVICLLVTGVAFWDRRAGEQKTLERLASADTPFDQYLANSDQVYWRRGLPKIWFLLNRPSFLTFNQGAGILFFRDTAMEYARRAKLVVPIDDREFFGIWNLENDEQKTVTALNVPSWEDVVAVCAASGGPNAVVLEYGFAGHWQARWALPLSVDRESVKNSTPPEAYYLYRCDAIPN